MASRVEALEALVKRVIEADKTTDHTGTRDTTNTAMIVDPNREDINVDVPRGMGMALDRNRDMNVNVSNVGFFASDSPSTILDPVRLPTSASTTNTTHPSSSRLLHPSYATSARTPGPDDDDNTGRALSMTMPDSLARGQQADEYHGDGFQDTLDDFMVRPSADQIDPSSLTRMSANLDAITEEPSEREIPRQHSYQLSQSDSSLTTTRKRQIDHDQQHYGRLTQTHPDQEGFDVGSSTWQPHATHDSRTQIPLAKQSNSHPVHRDHSGGGGLRLAEHQSQSRHVGFGAGSGNEAEQVRVGRSDLNLGLDRYQGGGTDLGSHHHPARSGGSSSPSSEGELGDGTLVISASGRSKYVGPTAGSEWLVDVSRPRAGHEIDLFRIRGS
jgi:hypothetical protein